MSTTQPIKETDMTSIIHHDDVELRILALSEAIRTHSYIGVGSAEIIDAAVAYEAYLKGGTK